MSRGFSMDNPTAERVARNEATFRAANERIREAAEEHEVDEAVPFICECADPACTTILRLSNDEYEEVRSVPTYFLNAHGHHRASGPVARVVETRGGYEITEKLDRAGEVAEELDPRERAHD